MEVRCTGRMIRLSLSQVDRHRVAPINKSIFAFLEIEHTLLARTRSCARSDRANPQWPHSFGCSQFQPVWINVRHLDIISRRLRHRAKPSGLGRASRRSLKQALISREKSEEGSMTLRAIMLLSALMLAVPGWTLDAAQGKHPNKNPLSAQLPEAPAGFDNKSNGVVDDQTHQADQAKFDEVEGVADGLGPLYNAQSCRECHQNPASGGGSQVTELRVGHLGPRRQFLNPNIPIAHGTEIISGRTLVNDRAICPERRFSRYRDPGACAG